MGIVAFYPSPKMPEYPKYANSANLDFNSSEYKAQQEKYKEEVKIYDAKNKEFSNIAQVHARNQYMISLGAGVLAVLTGIGIATISSTIGAGMIIAGGIVFTFGQILLAFSSITSVIARYSSSGSRDVTADLQMEFLVAAIGTILLLAAGIWKFRNKSSS